MCKPVHSCSSSKATSSFTDNSDFEQTTSRPRAALEDEGSRQKNHVHFDEKGVEIVEVGESDTDNETEDGT